MPDYSQGKIYRVIVPGCEQVYIGSTTKGLGTRLCNHRAHYKFFKDGKGHYLSVFKIFELGEPIIELVENFPCATKQELTAREDDIIKATDNCINRWGATKNPDYHKEWYERNKERVLAQTKAYQATHKEQTNRRRREKRAEKKSDK